MTIVGILKSGPGYEIGLSDRLKLKFNLPGQFKSVVMKNEQLFLPEDLVAWLGGLEVLDIVGN